MSTESDTLRYYGIRHHGPGCARSLVRALDDWRPDAVLIEGPPEADALLAAAAHAEMQPPVALLGYCPERPGVASFYPFAEFSPEWQAIRWALAVGATVQFIDLPWAHQLALDSACEPATAASTEESAEASASEPDASIAAAPNRGTEAPIAMTPNRETEAATAAQVPETPDHLARRHRRDPLGLLAAAAGDPDGETWWNRVIEERGDGSALFVAIAEAMTEVRAAIGDADEPAEARREAAREAHMRLTIQRAKKTGHARIAVVCGAWHVPALTRRVTQKDDQALLKPLPKLKIDCTWVPWTYGHLAREDYGASITAPGWYEHLWQTGPDLRRRTTGWFTRIARLLRERDLDCSSAHLIEATRLAETLAALRGRPAPGLPELGEAAVSVMTLGETEALAFIERALVIGERMGSVPADVPTVPLQRDLADLQKRLRLKPEALERTLELDLRSPNDLARSQLLHRLRLLGIDWGEPTADSVKSRGTFREVWTLRWQPEYALRLIECSRYGQTLLDAASARGAELAKAATGLEVLSELVAQALVAELPAVVESATQALDQLAAGHADAADLLATLPGLAQAWRYGSVRQTDTALVARVLDRLAQRAAIALPLATQQIADDAAAALRERILAGQDALSLRDEPTLLADWRQALALVTDAGGSHPLLQGLCARLLLDAGVRDVTTIADALALALALSRAAAPAAAAAWLEGFLNRSALILLHDERVFGLVDQWISGLPRQHFIDVLPLIRRCFAAFGVSERRDLAAKLPAATTSAATRTSAGAAPASWDVERAVTPLPILKHLLGIPA